MARLTISPIRSPRGHRNSIGSEPRECIQHSTRTAAAFTRSLHARYAAPAISSRCCGQVRWACIVARGGRKKLAEEDGTKCRLHVGEKRRRIKERLTHSQPAERKSGQPRKRIVMFFPSANSTASRRIVSFWSLKTDGKRSEAEDSGRYIVDIVSTVRGNFYGRSWICWRKFQRRAATRISWTWLHSLLFFVRIRIEE